MNKNNSYSNKRKTFGASKETISELMVNWDEKEDKRIRRELRKSWARWSIKYNKCKNCERKIFYNNKYDAYYCKSCNIWLEPKCGDKRCEFCSIRPVSPIKK